MREEGGKIFLEWTVDMKADGERFPGFGAERAIEAAKGWGPETIEAGADPLGRGFCVAAAAMDARRGGEDCGLGPLRMRVWLERLEGADEIWRIGCSAELIDPAKLERAGSLARQAFHGGASESLEEDATDALLRNPFADPETVDESLEVDGWDFGEETSAARGIAALERSRMDREGGAGIGKQKPRGM